MSSGPTPLADHRPARRPLAEAAIAALLPEVPRWQVVHADAAPARLHLALTFPDFASALAFANRVGVLADALDHHPELRVAWGKLEIDVWTHDARGLSEADFVLAARIDRALADGPSGRA